MNLNPEYLGLTDAQKSYVAWVRTNFPPKIAERVEQIVRGNRSAFNELSFVDQNRALMEANNRGIRLSR